MENNIDNTNVDTQQQTNEDKTFTQDDIDKAVAEATKGMLSQDEVNKIVEKRLAREKEKAEKERTQAEELAKLSAEERAKKEFEIEMAEKTAKYEEQMREFEKMKADFNQAQLLSQVQKELNDRNLPIGMANQLVGKDAEESMKNIQTFESDWNTSLQKAIDDKLKNSSSSPRQELKGDENKTKSVKDMSLSEYLEYRAKQDK